jgi:anti-sigma factor RsiW
MYDCSTIRTLIHPHLDGELDVKESLRVQAHLQECAPCREALLAEQAFRNFVRPGATTPPTPESVRQVVLDALSRQTERLLRARHRWRGLASPGMAAAVAALALFFAIPHQEVPDLVKVAVASHRRYMKDATRLQIKNPDIRAVTRWLEKRLPYPIHVPVQHATDIRLVGADVVSGRNPAAVLAYLIADDHASLLVAASREVHFPGANVLTFKNVLFHSSDVEGRHVLQWSDHRYTYVLVACRETPIDSLPFAVPSTNGS